MKKVFLAIAFIFSIATTAFSQTAGTYYFGSQSTPDLTMAPSHSGYNTFKTAIDNNTDGETVDWTGVSGDIAGIQSLSSYKSWLEANASSTVWVLCCYQPYGMGPCFVQIPLSCELCNCRYPTY